MPNTFAPRRYHFSFEAPYFAIWSADGEPIKTTATDEVGLISPPSVSPDRGAPRQIRFRNRGLFREAYAAGPPGTVVLVGRFVGADMHDLNALLWMLCATGACAYSPSA